MDSFWLDSILYGRRLVQYSMSPRGMSKRLMCITVTNNVTVQYSIHLIEALASNLQRFEGEGTCLSFLSDPFFVGNALTDRLPTATLSFLWRCPCRCRPLGERRLGTRPPRPPFGPLGWQRYCREAEAEAGRSAGCMHPMHERQLPDSDSGSCPRFLCPHPHPRPHSSRLCG